jgi:hypothetical protein
MTNLDQIAKSYANESNNPSFFPCDNSFKNALAYSEADFKAGANHILSNPSEFGLVKQEEVNIDLDSALKLRGYFGENDKSVFHHWAYSYFDRIIKNLQSNKP